MVYVFGLVVQRDLQVVLPAQCGDGMGEASQVRIA